MKMTQYISAVLITIITLSVSLSVQAIDKQPCFINAQSAYQHLLAQENKQAQTATIASVSIAININTASEAELVLLKGIGSKKAQSIIRYRQQHGNFATVDELTKVKGIGKKTVAKNRLKLSVNN